MKYALATLVALAAAPSIAITEESRELDAHEHGVGKLNIAIDGDTVAMEFHAPGADIVGFEYEATSAEDLAAIDAAVGILAKPLDLFVLPAAAACEVTQASAELESEEEHDDHDEHAEGEDHDDHDEHAEGQEHDDHEQHAEASHTEFYAEYLLTCGYPDELTGIDFAYFAAFENALELEVQIVTTSGAQAFEVERDTPMLDLSGLL